MNYFDKIPTVTYNNTLCKNLLARARLSDQTRQQKSSFYPYTMEDVERADILSNDYYDNPGFTWLIWITNNIIDPYYDMSLSEDDFLQYIIKKYGSYELAQRKILYFRNNWYNNTDVQITVPQFNSLQPAFKKYYDPVIDNNLSPVAFKRKRHDDVVSTNKVITLDVSNASGIFNIGEEIQVAANASNYAFVTYSNTTQITCQHVQGQFTSADSLMGQESGRIADIDNVTVINETIASSDAAYWSPVTILEHEQEQNQFKKTIQLLDPRYTRQAENDLKRTMSTR